ncbi:hypothetical protein LUX12_22505 [Streptomyces somaliensis]|uniref:Secreted protein n=1 Tax=Streptomyces somaliensis (strain ATCC 33201 / DSM 40738 / JCM 12659 / KCTC 9044 / NCTC 11332 / NRRL B-12077 / IP 733) TaxID=1134445 RepID=A0AA44DGY2_STRE0|nr:hypothetical protein [Streptomyces somaliensis]MCP9946952.1 hypothetical protein [Streptomyces somaliensis]MCP9963587.1 hypothetical protein [Streptomyces somaliensis]MCP9976155.1 hypothetical protein [Streptomyces somaliensis]MCQ0021566.1 hypothetical protein [Streptomyces somaliensis DSM 40738]NKY16062.1 hypothetical protein [Streptomyces somaliensis DSM 40738]
MKKRSMLAVASLAAGVITSLLTPSSHALTGDGLPEAGTLLGADDVTTLVDGVTGEAAQGVTPPAAGGAARH